MPIMHAWKPLTMLLHLRSVPHEMLGSSCLSRSAYRRCDTEGMLGDGVRSSSGEGEGGTFLSLFKSSVSEVANAGKGGLASAVLKGYRLERWYPSDLPDSLFLQHAAVCHCRRCALSATSDRPRKDLSGEPETVAKEGSVPALPSACFYKPRCAPFRNTTDLSVLVVPC